MPSEFRVRWHAAGPLPLGLAVLPPAAPYVDVSAGRFPSCSVPLPCPAPGVGVYEVECRRCAQRLACATTGQAGDPWGVTFACGSNR